MPTKQRKKFANKPTDFILVITVLFLLSLGIVMVLSASSPSSYAETGSSYTYVKKQAISAVLGLVAMYVISKIDYHTYKKPYKIAYVLSVLMLAAVPLIGHEVNGAKRWIDLGFTTFQPSELVKLLLIIFYAAYLTNNRDRLKELGKGFVIPFVYLAPVALILLLFQEHFSATLIIVLIVSVMMLVAGSKLSTFMTLGLAGGIAGIGLILTKGSSFRMNRLTSFLNPWADPQGDSYQIIQSLYAIGSGGLFGVGLRTEQAKIFVLTRTS